ncbi:MAG TPA: TolC family protein [Opitutaceae bacterium]|nr:TolC family protein [Opitutaceae bacterium]
MLVLPFALGAQPAGNVAGTLPEDYLPQLRAIIATALKQSPTMMQQNINLSLAEAARYGADSVLWPSVSGGASYGFSNAHVSSDGITGPSSSSSGISYSVGLGQPIFAWGALKASSDIAKLDQQIKQRQFAIAYRGLANSLRSQYLGLVAKKIGLRNSRAQVKLLEVGMANQEAMLKEGSVSSGDIILPRLALDEARLNLERAEIDLNYSRNIYRRLAGLDELAEESIPDTLPPVTFTEALADSLLQSLVQDGARNTLQAQVDQMVVKQQDLNYKIAKTSLYPKFSLGAGYAISNAQSVSGNSVSQSFVTSYSYSFSGGWTIFDGFRTRGAKMTALANKRSDERQAQVDLESTLDNAQNMRRQLGVLAHALNIAELRRALAQDGLKRTTEELNEGTVSQSTVDLATTSFASADYAAVSARMDYLNRWAEFVGLVGADPVLNALPVSYLSSSHGK